MSMRPPVDGARLEALLTALAQRVHVPVRFYLQGGCISVLQGRRGATVDVDYDAEVAERDFGEWERALCESAAELQINVEPAGPGDFLPLPEGWQARCRFVDQYGTVAVYTFDPYSTALAKLARGNRTDLADVQGLLRSGQVERARLRAMARSITPRWNARVARQSAEAFLAKVEAFLQGWEGRSDQGAGQGD